jgi:hypothetical protein
MPLQFHKDELLVEANTHEQVSLERSFKDVVIEEPTPTNSKGIIERQACVLCPCNVSSH